MSELNKEINRLREAHSLRMSRKVPLAVKTKNKGHILRGETPKNNENRNEQNKLHNARNQRVERAANAKRSTRRTPKHTGIVTFNNLNKSKSYPVQITFPLKEESKDVRNSKGKSVKSYTKNTAAIVSSSNDNAEVFVVFQEALGNNEPPPRLRVEFYKISGLKNNAYEIPLPDPANPIPENYKKVDDKDSLKTTRVTHEFYSRGEIPIFSITYSADIYIDLTDSANPRPFVWYLNIKDHDGTFNGVKYAQTNRNEKGITEVKSREERVFKGIPIYILDKIPREPIMSMLWRN
jgi:hypothetical protein